MKQVDAQKMSDIQRQREAVSIIAGGHGLKVIDHDVAVKGTNGHIWKTYRLSF